MRVQVNFSSNFVSFFIVMTNNSNVNFKLINFLLWIKEFHQGPNFETMKYSVKNFQNYLCHLWKQKSIFLQVLHQYSVINIPSNIIPGYLFSSKIIYFGQRQPIKVQIFEIFECSNQNSWNSLCRFWTDKLIPLQFSHHSSLSWQITPLQILSSYIFNFEQKNPIKVPILRLAIALVKTCRIPHFIFQTASQFFYHISSHFLISSKITTLYFFRSNITEGTNQSASFWDFWVLGSKFIKFSSFLKQQISFSWNFASIVSVMRYKNSSVLFYLKFYILSTKKSLSRSKFGEIKNLKFGTLMGSFHQSNIKFQLKKYRSVMSNDIEEWCKV